MQSLIPILLLSTLFPSTVSILGLDSINPISVQNFTCFKEHGYNFYIGRVYKSLGEVDTEVIENIKSARIAGFQFVDGYIFPCLMTTCKSAKEQIEETLNWIPKVGGQINRLWIAVQYILYWEAEKPEFNRAFILEAVKQAETMGFRVGIYTNSTHWGEIVGNDWIAISNKPLWLDNWSGRQSFDDFLPFGGWKIPAMQQFNPEYRSPCGVVIDENWYP